MMNNKMNSSISIVGTVFEVDIETQSLIQKENPGNRISFIDQMVGHQDHYDLCFDPKTHTALDPATPFNSSEHELVWIPPLIKLDPQGMADRYGFTTEQLKGRTDFEVIVNQEAYKLRKQGVLPQIDISGEKFIIDLRLQELRHIKHHYPALRLKDFDLDGNGDHYIAYYHPATRQIVELDPRLTEFPDGIIKISMPNELGLDPVGTARHYGINEQDLLRRHPIQNDLKAALIPLSETGIPALIQRNREQLQKEHQENAKRFNPSRKPRF